MEVELSKQLTPAEVSRKEYLEDIIEKGQDTFWEVAQAISEMKIGRLYRAEYNTFEEYCKEKWGMERNYANKLIRASEVVESLGTNVPMPKTEAVIRPLTRIKDPEVQREVYQKAVETAPKGKVTAKHVEKVVRETMPKPVPEPPVRRTKKEVYANLIPISQHRGSEWAEAFDAMLKAIVNARGVDWKTTTQEVMLDDLQTLKEAVQG